MYFSPSIKRYVALLSLILTLISMFLPWISLSFAGTTVTEVSLYYVVSDLKGFRVTFVKTDLMLLMLYGSVLMFGLTVIAGITCVIGWKKLKRASWVPGFGNWVLLFAGILWVLASF